MTDETTTTTTVTTNGGNGNGATTGSDLQAALRRLVYATVVLYLVLVVVGGYVVFSAAVQRNQLRAVAVTTNTALCTLRGNLVQRVEDSKQFLKDHPDGIPGINVADIQQSITNQESTIEALGILKCPPNLSAG